MKYKIGNVEVEAVQYNGENMKDIYDIVKVETIAQSLTFTQDEWVVVSGLSVFVLSEQDFNNMVTKVKFKVGDVAYHIDGYENDDYLELTISKINITKMGKEGYWGSGRYFCASDLFTLEEAIEQLKGL